MSPAGLCKEDPEGLGWMWRVGEMVFARGDSGLARLGFEI